MIFYHCSPVEFKPGDTLTLGKRGYICLSTSFKQALYWYSSLAFERGGDWTIYKVDVSDEEIVEDCRGHYHFEKEGLWVKAKDVSPHKDLDGEVNLFSANGVVKEVIDKEGKLYVLSYSSTMKFASVLMSFYEISRSDAFKMISNNHLPLSPSIKDELEMNGCKVAIY